MYTRHRGTVVVLLSLAGCAGGGELTVEIASEAIRTGDRLVAGVRANAIDPQQHTYTLDHSRALERLLISSGGGTPQAIDLSLRIIDGSGVVLAEGFVTLPFPRDGSACARVE